MRPYPPTLRERRRYIQFKAHGRGGEKEATQAIQSAMLSLFGEDGYAKSNFSIIRYEESSGVCRCTHDWLNNCLVALAFVREIGGEPGRIEVKGISGTIRGLAAANGHPGEHPLKASLLPKSF